MSGLEVVPATKADWTTVANLIQLYLYDMTENAADKIDPLGGNCCYGSAAFSPDGTHMLLVFQDVRLGDRSKNRLYYIPVDQLGTATEWTALPLPDVFFDDLDENIQLALHPAPQVDTGGINPNHTSQ